MMKGKVLLAFFVALVAVAVFNMHTVCAATEFMAPTRPVIVEEDEEEKVEIIQEEIVEEEQTNQVQTPANNEEVTTIVLSEKPAVEEIYYEEENTEEVVVQEEPVAEQMKEYKAEAIPEAKEEKVVEETTVEEPTVEEQKMVHTGDMDMAQVIMIALSSITGAILAVKQKATI